MRQLPSFALSTGWISLTIVGIAIHLFGLIVTILSTSREMPFLRSIGAPSIGMGFFGFLITVMAYRHRQRWVDLHYAILHSSGQHILLAACRQAMIKSIRLY